MAALPPRLLVLDLDGTLSDSLPDLASALNRSLARHGAAPLTLEQARGMVGDGIRPLFQRGYAARGRCAGTDLAAGVRRLCGECDSADGALSGRSRRPEGTARRRLAPRRSAPTSRSARRGCC